MKKLALILSLMMLAFCACEEGTSTSPDNNNPITITDPDNDSEVNGEVTILTSIGTDYNIIKVVFYVDNDSVSTDLTSPFSYVWDTDSYTDSSTHTIQARAWDDTSSYLSSTITVMIVRPGANEFIYLANYSTSNPAYRVAAKSEHLYIALGTYGLKVLDYSTPSSPIQTYSSQLSANVRGVDSYGSYLITAERDNGIRLFRIYTSPDTIISQQRTTTTSSAWNVKISGNIVYVADNDGVYITSISNYAFSYLSHIAISQGTVLDIDVNGSYVYILDNNGLTVYNISQPAEPEYVGRYTAFSGECQAVSIYGNYVFVGTSSELRMLTSTLDLAAIAAQQYSYTGVYAIDNVVFASQGGSDGGVRAFDYSSGDSLAQIDSYFIGQNCYDVTYDDGYVFLAGDSEIAIFSFIYSTTD